MGALLRTIHDRLSYIVGPLLAPPGPLPPTPSPAPTSNRLLAIFPDSLTVNLDYSREKRTLREAGGPWQLVILEREHATREEIANELRQGGARLVYLGSHGTDERVVLSQGESAGREYLARIVRQFGIEAVVMNACDSDGLASACLNSGAKVVVSTLGKIDDRSAGLLGVALIEGLARGGTTVDQAVGYALAMIDDASADMIRVRGDGSWLWERRGYELRQ